MALFKNVNGVDIPLTAQEETQLLSEWAANAAAIAATDYLRKREREYPKIQDQLDIIYNEGLDAWKAEIKKVKDKYPKPN